LLAPTIMIFAVINPLGWLLYSLGLVRRSLRIALAFAPTIIAGYVLGLQYGPSGVAFGYSAVLTLWVIPFIAWCVHGTPVSFRDILLTVARPLVFGILAGGLAFGAQMFNGQSLAPLPKLVLETSVLLATFFGLLLFVGGQKTLYLDLVRGFRKPSLVETPELTSA
jgi:O-antigen/teichoic acid export membrane protein